MSPPRLLGLAAAVLVLSTCSNTPTEVPQPIDADLLVPLADHGGSHGAMVIRLTDDEFLLPTVDPGTGLVSVHYNSATFVGDFLGCELPPFEGVVDLQLVNVPTGKQKRLFSGSVWVRIHALAGFPFNACDEPIAEGIVDIHGVDHLVAPGVFEGVRGSFASNGVITRNADGSDVRLHHTTKITPSGGFPPQGTVRLR